ncbi:MAG: histone deacetylase [Flavobacteriaceae bacterium]
MIYVAFDSCYAHPLPEGHRFPMLKYELLPRQLIHEGTCGEDQFFRPNRIDYTHVLRAHAGDYLDKLLNLRLSAKEVRKLGFPLSEQLVSRELHIAQGTLDGALYALEHGIALNIAGGTHHAYAEHGEAFCLLNDQAIAAHYLLAKQLAQRILIIDLDVHQGNGTAVIFQNNPRVFTLSMHGKANYPFKKELSDLDIELDKGTEDNAYLRVLAETLEQVLNSFNPDFIFYLSGVDVLATDKLGSLALTLEGCKKRDALVLGAAQNRNIPLQCSMGGGYSKDLRIIVEAHANTYRVAKQLFD